MHDSVRKTTNPSPKTIMKIIYYMRCRKIIKMECLNGWMGSGKGMKIERMYGMRPIYLKKMESKKNMKIESIL